MIQLLKNMLIVIFGKNLKYICIPNHFVFSEVNSCENIIISGIEKAIRSFVETIWQEIPKSFIGFPVYGFVQYFQCLNKIINLIIQI